MTKEHCVFPLVLVSVGDERDCKGILKCITNVYERIIGVKYDYDFVFLFFFSRPF